MNFRISRPAIIAAAIGAVLSPSASPAQGPLPLPSSPLAPEFFHQLGSAGGTTIWVAPSTWKVERATPAPAAVRDGIELSAAGNEYEPVQIVIRSASAGTRAVSVSSTWTGPATAAIQATLHDVIFEGAGPCPAGMPDRLNPVEPGTAVPACAAVNEVFWLTLQVPSGTTAGDYTGEVTITAPGLTISVPLRLHVFGFSLPAQGSFHAMSDWPFSGVSGSLPAVNRWFHEHRLIPAQLPWPSGFGPQITWPSCGPFYDEGDQPPAFSVRWLADTYIAGHGFNDGVGFPRFITHRMTSNAQPRPSTFCGIGISGDPRGPDYGTAAYNQEWGRYLRALQDYCDPAVPPASGGNPFGNDYLSKGLYWVMNEPVTAADHALAAWLASVSRQHAPGLRLMISEEAKPEIFANPAYPGNGYDVWVGHLRSFAGAVGHAWDRKRDHGEQSWWYATPFDLPHYPNPLQVSRPAVETRILAWLAWRHRVTGWFDGALEAPILNVSSGGTPVLQSTIRAELLRESFEDYEYFMLANAGSAAMPELGNAADAFVEPAAVSLTGFERDPCRLHWQRLQLGKYLSRAAWQTQAPADPVRPYGSYYFNFQNPAGFPTDSPLVSGGRTWTKVGWSLYDETQRFGWFVPGSLQLSYSAHPGAGAATDIERSGVYDDYATLCTFVVGLEDGVYDVEVTMGRPTAASHALVTVNGVDFFGNRRANEPEALTANVTRSRRMAVSSGRLVLDVGEPHPGSYWFLNSLAITAVSPGSRDSLDDLWQAQHFGQATDSNAAPEADPDQDGADNRSELYFGTAPNDPASRSIAAASLAQDGSLTFAWQASPGRQYRIESSPDLTEWTTELTVRATGGSADAVLPGAASAVRSFYRVTAVIP